MKKILLVNDIHFNGGGERVACNIASHYAEKEENVIILSFAKKKDTSIFPIHPKVKIEYLNVSLTKVKAKFIILMRLYAYISKNLDGVYFGIGTYANVLLGLIKYKIKNIKAIGCEHNSFDITPFYWNLLRKLTYHRLNTCVVLTFTDLKAMKRLNENSTVIPNSFISLKAKAKLENTKFLAIGRLSDQKNFSELIDIYAKYKQLANADDPWHLDIYGQGELESNLRKKIIKLGLEKYINIRPFCFDVTKVYTEASCLLMTSKYEGLPMVLIEAQDCGLPIISYDCNTGPRDVISPDNGFLIPVGDKEAFVKAMLSVSKSYNMRKKMGQSASISSLRFSPDVIYPKWDCLIKNI